MQIPARLPNLLGALALAVSDRQAAAMQTASGLGPSACATILTLGEYPGTNVTALAAILGLTHSATVRLTADLATRGLLDRAAGEDRRAVALTLTPAGETARRTLLSARETALRDALAPLAAGEAALLDGLAERLLVHLTTDRRTADHLCRLCDSVACGGEDCPVERHARDLPEA